MYKTCTYVNDDSLSGCTDINLLGSGDVQVSQVCLQLAIGGLQVKDSLHPSRNMSCCGGSCLCALTETETKTSQQLTCATESSKSSGSAPLSFAIFFRAENMLACALGVQVKGTYKADRADQACSVSGPLGLLKPPDGIGYP